MDQYFDLEQEQETGNWERRFCVVEWCDAHAQILYVQRASLANELWRVRDGDAESVFLVAAPVPICPHCGGHLLTGANLEEGIGKLPTDFRGMETGEHGPRSRRT